MSIGDARALIDLALQSTDDAEITTLTREVIRSGSASAMVHFASSVPGADTDRFQDAVIATGDATMMFAFARKIPGADIDRLHRAVIISGDPWTIASFAAHVSGADAARLDATLAWLRAGNVQDIGADAFLER